jgi:cytochrome d ubiquinol oxidase subunit I
MTWNQLLPLIFMAVMGLALLAYVILDGYDLGVGILLPFATDDEKDIMVSSIGPFWDANETWLVLGIGVLLVSWWCAWALWRDKSFSRLQLWVLTAMTFSGWVSTLAGWYVTEIGRQPFVVYGLVRTADTVAPHPAGMVLSTLIAYLAVYVFLLAAYVLVLMYMASHPAQATLQTPQSPKAALPIRGAA